MTWAWTVPDPTFGRIEITVEVGPDGGLRYHGYADDPMVNPWPVDSQSRTEFLFDGPLHEMPPDVADDIRRHLRW